MKKVRSPLREQNKQDFSVSIKNNIKKQLLKPYRPINSLFTVANEEQKKRDASSIRKVLKELTDLKKQLRDIKTTTRTNSQGLDMSACRKLVAERKSPSSPYQKYSKSHSSSRNKSNSHAKEISTQTKAQNQQINEFSFSVDSKSGKKYQKLVNQSSSEDSDYEEYPQKKRSQMSTKRIAKNHSQKALIHTTLTDRVTAIQSSELYEKHLNTLKHNIDTIQISSTVLSTEDKLRLNIEVQRMSKYISRIPIYMTKPQQYYETIQLYARNLNNQLNNFILLLNRSKFGRSQENSINNLNQSKRYGVQRCRNCDQNEKKGIQKTFKRELKRYQKQVNKLQDKIDKKQEEVVKTSHIVASLLKDIEKHKEDQNKNQEKIQNWQKKYFQLQKQSEQGEKKIVQTESERIKQIKRISELEADLAYYRNQLQKVKHNVYEFSQQKQNKNSNAELKNKELEMVVAEVKGKEHLYQTIIKERDGIIQQLREELQSRRKTPAKSALKGNKHQIYESQNDSIDSAEYYKQKTMLKQKQQLCAAQIVEIQYLKEAKVEGELKYKEVLSNLQLCLGEIDKLHSQIDHLHGVNQRYKDKCLKAKITNQKKGKREVEAKQQKSETFTEINDLIRHHREALAKEKK